MAESKVAEPATSSFDKFEEWMNANGQAIVAVADAKKTNAGRCTLRRRARFIVLAGEEKLLVTVRPNLPTKNANAAREVQKVFGAPYRSVRIWPSETEGEWKWDEHLIDIHPR
jgi:hypothetical protein